MATMGGPSIPGVGWAGGIDRLAMMLSEEAFPPSGRPLAVLPMDQAFEIEGLKLARTLRKEGHVVEMTYGGNLGKRLKKANKMNARYALILGEEEISSHMVTLKDLDTSEQIQVPQDQLSMVLKEKGVV